MTTCSLAATITVMLCLISWRFAHAETLYTKTQSGVVSVSGSLIAETCEQGRRLALAEFEQFNEQSKAWWGKAMAIQQEYREQHPTGELMPIEGWPTLRSGAIVQAECLK